METEDNRTIELTEGNKIIRKIQDETEEDASLINASSDEESYKAQLRQLDIAFRNKELRHKEEVLKQLEQNRNQRKKFGKWVLFVVSMWLGWVIVIVTIHAFFIQSCLSEKVLCVLLGATAIVSLATTVLKGLFQNDDHKITDEINN